MTAFPLPETITARSDNMRVEQETARRILARTVGMTAADAYRAVKFRPGMACPPLARVLEQGLAEARRRGVEPGRLTVAAWEVGDGQVITRLRRMAHGVADWITTRTTGVSVELAVAAPPPAPDAFPSNPAGNSRAAAAAKPPAQPEQRIRELLRQVIDPDLGVNIVDLGFIRGVRLRGRMAELQMTLTNRFCPLNSVFEDQMRTALVGGGLCDEMAVEWVFDPPWTPDEVSDEARRQLREIGFAGM